MALDLHFINAASHYDRLMIQSRYDKYEDCSICLDSLFNKKIMHLPCKHAFHSSCLNECFSNKLYNCPLCRYNLNEALTKINFNFPTQPQPQPDLNENNLYEMLNSYFYYRDNDFVAIGTGSFLDPIVFYYLNDINYLTIPNHLVQEEVEVIRNRADVRQSSLLDQFFNIIPPVYSSDNAGLDNAGLDDAALFEDNAGLDDAALFEDDAAELL